MARGKKRAHTVFRIMEKKAKKESSDCIAVIEGFLSVTTTGKSHRIRAGVTTISI